MRPWRASPLVAFAGAALVAAAATAGEAPERLRTREVTSRDGVVVCASADAARAGASILAAGGNAVDAAAAAALALGVSEVGGSGLGGQTYMLICLADRDCVAIDGSVSAPLAVSRAELARMVEAGRFYGHKVAAAPATLATLDLALARYGSMPLARVIAPAIAVADAGTTFTPTLQSYVEGYLDKLRESPYLANLLLRDGLDVWGLEHRYCFPDIAATLRRIANEGPRSFYEGAMAQEIAADMAANGGYVGAGDLARVRPVVREPARGSYRGYEVVSFPPPGGGAAVVAALQILDTFSPKRLRDDGADKHLLYLEAVRLALADEHQIRQIMPASALPMLERTHAGRRANLIRRDRALTRQELGDTETVLWGDRDTTQLSVADRHGNVVSVTQTLGRMFGAYAATPGLGFPYNGLLEAFDLTHPESRSFLLPLRVPFTSQAPTIVRRNGRAVLVLGSVGSGRITSAVVLAISNVIDRGMTLAQAVASPRVLWGGNHENKVYLELAGEVTDQLADALAARGYTNIYRLQFPPRQGELNTFGAVNSIAIADDGTMIGVGDPRRSGVAAASAYNRE